MPHEKETLNKFFFGNDIELKNKIVKCPDF